ncbi:MAG: phosphate--acyl-ACP acyltransferase, partial [Oscillospiraceae bacterium]|nr:phosphate--acyl-ACP acyltransferase [Oscillospiraceae bacterium]
VKDGLDQFKNRLDPDAIGGTPFLGLQKPVIKAHGASSAKAIENAVYQAERAAQANLAAEIEASIELMRVKR